MFSPQVKHVAVLFHISFAGHEAEVFPHAMTQGRDGKCGSRTACINHQPESSPSYSLRLLSSLTWLHQLKTGPVISTKGEEGSSVTAPGDVFLFRDTLRVTARPGYQRSPTQVAATGAADLDPAAKATKMWSLCECCDNDHTCSCGEGRWGHPLATQTQQTLTVQVMKEQKGPVSPTSLWKHRRFSSGGDSDPGLSLQAFDL